MSSSKTACLPTISLPGGGNMPVMGFGTFQMKGEEVRCAVKAALECGYRHIDTAYMYQNETVIGEVLQEWISSGRVTREELFISTKLPMIGNRAEDVARFLDKSLESLQLSYVDLYLIHHPVGLKGKDDDDVWAKDSEGNATLDDHTNLETLYKAMEEQVERGKAKYIGLSNFSCNQIVRILKVCRIKPANHQIEMHAYFQQREMRKFCKKNNITICAYAPLGAPYKPPKGLGPVPLLLENPVVTSVATRLKKTPAQILLRFLIQLDAVSVIPKSARQERIRDNFQVFDFKLNPEDMASLEGLDHGIYGMLFNFKVFKGIEKHPEYPC